MVIEDQTKSYLSGSYIEKWIDNRTRSVTLLTFNLHIIASCENHQIIDMHYVYLDRVREQGQPFPWKVKCSINIGISNWTRATPTPVKVGSPLENNGPRCCNLNKPLITFVKSAED